MPQLWEITKRFILHGALQFQRAGLEILAQLIGHFPVDEALETIEEYFRRWDYLPSDNMRGGLTIPPLKAAYAVATTFGYHHSKDRIPEEVRKERVLSVLEETRTRARKPGTGIMAQDAAIVDRAINAIKAENPSYESAIFSRSLERPAGQEATVPAAETEPRPMTAVATVTEETDHSDTAQIVGAVVERFRREVELDKVTQIDILVAQHRAELLNEKLTAVEERVGVKLESIEKALASMDKAIDRNIGNRQISWGKWGVITGVAALVITVVFAVWQQVFG